MSKQNKQCKPLLDLLRDSDSYDTFIEHTGGYWIDETTQLQQIPLDFATALDVYRQPKPTMHYIKDAPVDQFATVSPLEYYEYPLTKWQTKKRHRYYLGVNQEANTVIWAYVGWLP